MPTTKTYKLLRELKAGKGADVSKVSDNLKVVILTLHCSKRVLSRHRFGTSTELNNALRKLISRAYPGLLL
jgi:hypothetical protein